ALDPVALVGEVQVAVLRASLGVARGRGELVQVVPEGVPLRDLHPVVLVSVDDEHRGDDPAHAVLGVVLRVLAAHRPLPAGVVGGVPHRFAAPQGGVGDDAAEAVPGVPGHPVGHVAAVGAAGEGGALGVDVLAGDGPVGQRHDVGV